ncbi:MAG: TonB-dependent receptor [Mariprofundaceae bacterium]|nr:TonB-dependent receptor [Mariprofundaceae bacterium]
MRQFAAWLRMMSDCRIRDISLLRRQAYMPIYFPIHTTINIRSFMMLAAMSLCSSHVYAADKPVIIQVESTAIEQLDSVTIKPSEQTYMPADTADILTSVAGANINKNGPLTGIAQYRGMFGSRINVQIDGLNVAPAGPNWMDPPLSHIPPSQLAQLKVIRGISPVSAGAESIGGSIQAKRATLPYGDNHHITPHGTVSTGYDQNNQAYTIGGQVGVSSESDQIQFNGNIDKGKDMQAGNGLNIVPTAYQRHHLGIQYGHRFNRGDFNLGYNHERVDNSGSPALPMDIIYVKGNALNAGFQSHPDSNDIQWLAEVHSMNTDHKMDNYSLRTPPTMLGMMGTPLMKRFNIAHSKDFAYKLHAAIPTHSGTLTLGTDTWMTKHQSDISDPNNSTFAVQNYNNIKRDRFSVFGEWKSALTDTLGIQTGLRYSRVHMDAGTVSARGFMGMLGTQINTLANNFNASQRNQNDNLVDLSLQLTQKLNDNLTFKIGAARKQRAPAYQERYLWSPLESTAGLADKRTYVGNVHLSPETAYTIDAGVDWTSDRIYFTPHVFYKRVKNYIQGTPVTSGTAYNFRKSQGNMLKGGGFCTAHPLDPFCVPLKYANVDAEFYGADAGFGGNITDKIALDGTISYVRGKRKDITDNLYRIAPLNSTIGLSYYADAGWSITTEGNFYGKQNKVSHTNTEQKTAGYSLFNLKGRYAINSHINLTAGVNNIMNRFYQNHLSGYNRVTKNTAGQASAVATGARLPGEGRNFFVQAHALF